MSQLYDDYDERDPLVDIASALGRIADALEEANEATKLHRHVPNMGPR